MKKIKLLFLIIGIIFTMGCQKSENTQEDLTSAEQNEMDPDENSKENDKENTVSLEELEKTLENNIVQTEVYINSSTAKGTSFILDTTESIKEIENMLFKDKDYESTESAYEENVYDFLLSIYYVSSDNNQEIAEVYVFAPDIIKYNSVFYKTENAIDYSYIREQIEENSSEVHR